ncbi:MAG: hypothetical protein ACPLXS_03340, partial [Candidatus Micrarchaeales archaeon]
QNKIWIFKDDVKEVKIQLSKEEFEKLPSILKEVGFKERRTQTEEDLVVIEENGEPIKIRSFEAEGKNFVVFIYKELVIRIENNANFYYSEILNENSDVKVVVRIKKKRVYFEKDRLQAQLDKDVTIKVNGEEKNLGNFLEISYPPKKEEEKYKLLEKLKEKGINVEIIEKHYYEIALEKEGFNKIRN